MHQAGALRTLVGVPGDRRAPARPPLGDLVMSVSTQERPPLTVRTPNRRRAVLDRVEGIEHRAAEAIRPYSLTMLRLALGTVFVWFGALKLFDVTPVGDLVAGTVPFLDASWFVPVLGAGEVALGLALMVGRYLTALSAALVAHLSGTFLVLVVQPELAFQHGNPLLLTTIGEFVVKNIVLVCAALVLASRLRESRDAGTAT